MDEHAVDRLARYLAARRASRRVVLRGLVGGGIGGVIGGTANSAAVVRCRTAGARCDRRNECCSRRCRDGRCAASRAGTCRSGQDFCINSATCNDDPGCGCFTVPEVAGGGRFCGQGIAACVASCDLCLAGETCVLGGSSCGCGDLNALACAAPCGRR